MSFPRIFLLLSLTTTLYSCQPENKEDAKDSGLKVAAMMNKAKDQDNNKDKEKINGQDREKDKCEKSLYEKYIIPEVQETQIRQQIQIGKHKGNINNMQKISISKRY